jgi:hypothetical protein
MLYGGDPGCREAMEHPMTVAAETALNPKLSAKDEVRALLDRLPDSATLEDIAYHLDVFIKVLEAEAQLDRGEGITQDEFDQRFAKWLAT